MVPQQDNINFQAVVFDLDGVITKTALVHAAAWRAMFNEYLRLREKRDGEPFKEFTHEHDYLHFVDGKPRYKGVEDFLMSRHISIAFGDKNDSPDIETVCGLGNGKNVKFMDILKKDGVQTYPSTVALIKNLKARQIHIGIASSSKNCQFVLQSVGLEQDFETRVDGVVSAELGLKGKPEGDIFVRAAQNMGVEPEQAVVVEDAVSGVEAGVNGGFGLVIGVARENNEEELKHHGAHVVIADFEGVTVQTVNQWFKAQGKA